MSDEKKYQLIRLLIGINVFLIPFYFFRFSIFGVRTNIFELLTLLIFILFLIVFSFDLTIRKLRHGTFWVYLLLLSAFVSLFIVQDRLHASGVFKGWFFFPFIFYFLIINNFNRDNIKKLSVPAFLSLLIVSAWAIMQKLGFVKTLFYQVGDSSFDQYLANNFRAFGPFESPNYLAMFIVPSIFLSLPILQMIRSNLLRFLGALSFALPVLSLYFSTSRGGAVALVVSVLAFLLFLFFRSKNFRKSVEELSQILIFGLIFTSTLFLIYVVRIISPNQGGDSIRIQIYEYSFELLKRYPVFGIGLGNFYNKIAEISSANYSFQEYGLSYAIHPHNLFMAMWLNLGILGLIAFIAISIIIVKHFFFCEKKKFFTRGCMFAAFIAIVVHGIFDTTYFKKRLISNFLVYSCCVINLSKEELRWDKIYLRQTSQELIFIYW